MCAIIMYSVCGNTPQSILSPDMGKSSDGASAP